MLTFKTIHDSSETLDSFSTLSFRTIDGSNNNLTFRPIGGSDLPAETTEIRIAPADFTTTPIGADPNPRTISDNIATFGGLGDTQADETNSAWLYVFGQFVDHDLDKEALDPAINRDVIDPITGAVIPLGGSAGPDAVNTVAGYLDLSQVYGSDAATAASLRNADGTMKTGPGGSVPIVDGQFVSGDVRVGENPELTAVTSLFVREHNFWVGQLALAHPDWTGDQLYDTARAITTAEYQHIVFEEFLPSLIGSDLGPYRGFDPNVNANVTMEFTTAAFRVGHSQVSGEQTRIDNNGNETFTQTLAEAFFATPEQSIGDDNFNGLLRHLSAETSQATDPYFANDLCNALFAPPQLVDLIAIDIQRERDLGLGTLNETRTALGLAPYTSFADLSSDPQYQALYAAQYGSIDNVDLFMGGLAEDHTAGAVGETFAAIIADQFSRLRAGDPYWWQNQGFDPKTAAIIGQTTLSDIITRNADTPALQKNVFVAAERHLSSVAAAEPDAPQLVIGVNDDNATIAGGPGDDTIVAGAGLHQVLTGGGGGNVFVFLDGGHRDTISDFDATADKIEFATPETLADMMGSVRITVSDLGDPARPSTGALVRFDDNEIALPGVAKTSVSAANFIAAPGAQIVVDHGNGAVNSSAGCGGRDGGFLYG
jgi:Animal haem peroxidase